MARFVIRNYGPSRQVAYKAQQICLSNDQCIETDDAKMADVLGAEESIHVTDRGVEAATYVSPENRAKKDRKVTVDDAEAVHDEKFPDEDVPEQQTQETQEIVSDEDANELSYDDMFVPELQALCKDRSIKTSRLKKGALIEALEDYDEEE